MLLTTFDGSTWDSTKHAKDLYTGGETNNLNYLTGFKSFTIVFWCLLKYSWKQLGLGPLPSSAHAWHKQEYLLDPTSPAIWRFEQRTLPLLVLAYHSWSDQLYIHRHGTTSSSPVAQMECLTCLASCPNASSSILANLGGLWKFHVLSALCMTFSEPTSPIVEIVPVVPCQWDVGPDFSILALASPLPFSSPLLLPENHLPRNLKRFPGSCIPYLWLPHLSYLSLLQSNLVRAAPAAEIVQPGLGQFCDATRWIAASPAGLDQHRCNLNEVGWLHPDRKQLLPNQSSFNFQVV